MKKLILSFIKSHEQKNKLDLISELLISGTVEENIELFNKAKAIFMYNMDKEEMNKQKEIKLINSIKEKKREYNPAFYRPLSDLNVDFEIVKK